MTRAWLLLAAALPLLSGCPIPQPLAEVTKSGGVTAPPRILNYPSAVLPAASITFYDPTCLVGHYQSFTVSASIGEEIVDIVDDYRWFLDYDPVLTNGRAAPLAYGQLLPPVSLPLNVRPVPGFAFTPAAYDADHVNGAVHVVELVVSNGFEAGDQSLLPQPYRTADATHEVQSFRWVFAPKPGLGRCAP